MFSKIRYSDEFHARFDALSPDGATSDKLFFLVLYCCLGLLPPLIPLLGSQIIQIPFFVISFFIMLRMAMRPDCYNTMMAGVSGQAVLAGFALVAVVTIYGLIDVISGRDSAIFGKAVGLFMGLILLLFISKTRIDRQTVSTFAISGIVVGLLFLVLAILWNSYITSGVLIEQTSGELAVVTYHRGLYGFLVSVNLQNRALEILSVLLFFIAFTLKNRRTAFLFALIMGLIVLMVSFQVWGYSPKRDIFDAGYVPSETVQFGLIAALLVLLAAWFKPKLTTNMFFAALLGGILCAPLLYQILYALVYDLTALSHTFLVRTEIWDGAARKILESPLWGHGINALADQKTALDLRYTHLNAGILPMHPHNMVLQLWLDLGLLGVAPVLYLLWQVWHRVNRIAEDYRASILAGFTMLAVFTLVTHSLWHTWSQALIFISLALLLVWIPKAQLEQAALR